MVQIYEQVVSDIENKDTGCNLFALAAKILVTLLKSTVVEYYYFGRQKIRKIKIEPFLIQ